MGLTRIKASSGHFQEPPHWKSWPIGFSRIEGLAHNNLIALKLEELANWILKN
jgi:hypothetical protein